MSFQFDKNRVKTRIREGLEKVYSGVDPHLLNQYRALIKKEVSFFRRSYLTAYFLMELDQGAALPGEYARPSRSRRFTRPPAEEGGRGDPSRYPLAEEDSARLFISIGRSHRVFPREILGLIISRTSTPKDDIGAIRILDNYSFVQVRNSTADNIIEALNGKPFRGKTLSVNYARNRKEETLETLEPDTRKEEPSGDTAKKPPDESAGPPPGPDPAP